MQDFVDQEKQTKDFQLGSLLRQHLRKQQMVRLILVLILAAICIVLFWVDSLENHNKIHLALGILLGILVGMHISARWISPLISKAAKRLEGST